MALNYTQIFSDVGKYLKSINLIRDMAMGTGTPSPNLPSLLSAIETQLAASGRQDVLDGTVPLFDSYRDSAIGWINSHVSKIEQRLTERNSVVNQLAGSSNTFDTLSILKEIARQMIQDSQTIKSSSVVVGGVTAFGANHGTGLVVVTNVLDGVTSPGAGMPPLATYLSKTSELSVPTETMSLTCVQDEDTNGAPSGQEVFQWEGQPSTTHGRWGWRSEGSGENVQIFTANAYDLISNRDFEFFTNTNEPTGWDIVTGVAGVGILQETTGAQVHRGLAALKFVGAAEIRQTVIISQLIPGKRYILGVALKGDATANGTFTMGFTSDSGGYTAGVGETISLNASALQAIASGYTQEHCWITIPSTLPDDLEFQIKYTGASGTIRIDSIALAPCVYANGVSASIFAGSTQFVLNDRFTFAVTNTEGVFQSLFRCAFLLQLPSAGSPSILDSLAL